MSDTIQSLLQDGKLKTSMITVKLVKEISANSYIIADKTMVALLDISDAPSHGKNLSNGSWYKLIKCQKGDQNTIKTNKLFKPVRSTIKQELTSISSQVKKLEKTIASSAGSKKYEDFQNLSKKPNQSKIDKITVKAITKSRVINTDKGNYQICNIKDSSGNTTSINLYSKYLNSLEPFKIYSITNLRKAEVNKDDTKKMRLHTTNFTKVEIGTLEDSLNFQNIGNGDKYITGEVIGCGDYTPYQSCKLHFKKLDENHNCPKCDKELQNEEIIEDGRTEVYIEAQKGEEDGKGGEEGKGEEEGNEETEVKEIIIFKRVINLEAGENIEEHLNKLVGQIVKIDYNTDDAERSIAVSIKLIK